MKGKLVVLLSVFAMFTHPLANSADLTFKPMAVQETKREILTLAESYSGQGDPDRSKQKSFESLVQKLLSQAPQPALKDRLSLLAGAWKQIWGPYDYRNERRGVDPNLGVDEIYQVVSEHGFYYNVAPEYKGGDRSRERILLLRGEYRLDDKNANLLRVRFTSLSSVTARPADKQLWQLPALAESHELNNRTTVLPGFLVRLFFGGGALREVHTDQEMRITYGSNGKDLSKDFIYVMTRVK